jgi:diguanylate cyclase (GGDEF)-like protein
MSERTRRILFVDDEKLAREAFADSLKERGFDVDVADSADEALGLVAEHPYAVVASDWRMPRLNGIDLIRRLRPKLPDASFLLVTGAPHDLPDDPAFEPVDGIVQKPWKLGSLAKEIQKAVDLHEQRRAERSSQLALGDEKRVLLVEDNPGDAGLVERLLRRAGDTRYLIEVAPSLAKAMEALRHDSFDVALVDLSLPDAHGIDCIREVQSAAPNTPIVVLSGFSDEPLALQAVQAGAQDYLVKGEVEGRILRRSIRYAIERKLSEERLAFLAHHDQLTGLGNRSLFRERLGRAISKARRTGCRMAVLFLDLDRFKTVNDSLGHDVGDMLLEGVAERLLACLRDLDTVARLGGDEFAILLEEVSRERDAPTVAQRILDALSSPFDFNGHEIVVSGSIGVSFFPDNGDSMGQLLRAADSALYRAKESGRNAYQFFNKETHSRVVERMRLESELRRALERREFTVFYQPKLDLKAGHMSGFEALIRWQHNEMGMVSPGQFIPLLEDTGLIIDVGAWILETAARQLREWQANGFSDLSVAVNLSARQFEDGRLVETVKTALSESGLASRHLELEITESILMVDTQRTVQVLEELRKLGVKIAIDDFGTGYSSLAYLKRFPIDSLKIDRSFVQDITEDPEDACIANAIIGLAHNLGLTVVAEGVETSEQLEMLRECDGMQGFLYSKPRSVSDLSKHLHELHAVSTDSLLQLSPA